MAASDAGLLKKALDEGVKGLKHKDNVRENILPVTGNMSETFDIRVETPEVLILKIKKSGKINLSLFRTGKVTGYEVDGTVSHFTFQQELVYKRSYRADRDGYENSFQVNDGDILSIGMEAAHFGSEITEKGSRGMHATVECSLSYSKR